MTQRSRASAVRAATRVAAFAAVFVAGCGGDGDSVDNAGAQETYTLAVRPHLGAVEPGAKLALYTLMGSQQYLATIPPSGDPVFKIPKQYCGPGLVGLVGSDSTVYFDEGSNQKQVLGEGNHVRALVPDVCDVNGVMSLSMLDEIGLHMSSGQAEGFRRVAEAATRGFDPVAGVDPQVRADAVKAATALRDDISASLGATLGLPPKYQNLLPTMIDSPSTKLPDTPEGQIAATLRAIQEAAAEARRQAIEQRTAQLEAQAALLAEEANRLRQQAQDRFASSILAAVFQVAAGQMAFQYGESRDVAKAHKALGAGAAQVLQDIPSVLDRVAGLMPTYPAAVDAVAQAKTNAKAGMPVANADLTIALRTALTPMLLRGEPVARFQQVVERGVGMFSCSVGDVTRGAVSITSVESAPFGVLSSGDQFTLNYVDCITQEPLSGVTVVRTGTMTVIYDDATGDSTIPDIRAHVTFDMRLHAGEVDGSTKRTTLYEARGSWVDRTMFGAPGEVSPMVFPDVRPFVMLDDATLTLSKDEHDYMTQLGAVRLDMTDGFDSTNAAGNGQAVLRVSGMGGGVGYNTPLDMSFVHAGNAFDLHNGSFVFSRDGGTGGGTIGYGDGNLFKVTLTDGAGVTTERMLTWRKIITAYLTAS